MSHIAIGLLSALAARGACYLMGISRPPVTVANILPTWAIATAASYIATH